MAICFNTPFDYKINDTQTDEEGRYIILDLDINSVRNIIVNVYAPNSDDPQFFVKLIEKIEGLSCPNIVWGGDFNLVLCLDKGSKQPTLNAGMR